MDEQVPPGPQPPDAPPPEHAERVPEEWEIEGPAVSISLGDAADVDPALLAAMTGPDGLGGEALGPQFGQHHPADALRPGPILAALTEQAVADAATLSDDQLTGALQAARRLENRACWQQTVVTAELARRRQAQHEDARARKVPRAVGRVSSPPMSSRPSCSSPGARPSTGSPATSSSPAVFRRRWPGWLPG